MWLALVVGVLAAFAPAASARTLEASYARLASTEETAVVQAVAYDLPRASAYTYALVGRHKRGERIEHRAFLVRCDRKQCVSTSLWLAAGDIEVLGVVDLAGAPLPVPTQRVFVHRGARGTLGAPTMKRPVLLVRTSTSQASTTSDRAGREVSGTDSASRLAIISLARADEQNPRIFDGWLEGRGPTGAGHVVTYTFERGAGKALELVASDQRILDSSLACIPPPPTKTRYTLGKDRRYHPERAALPMSGCG